MGFWLGLIFALALNVVAYLIMPKPKVGRHEAARDFQDPTADAGRPIPVVFGTINVSGLNVLWYGNKSISKRKVKV